MWKLAGTSNGRKTIRCKIKNWAIFNNLRVPKNGKEFSIIQVLQTSLIFWFKNSPHLAKKKHRFSKKKIFWKIIFRIEFSYFFLKKKLEFGDKLDFQQHCTRHLKNDLDQLGYFEVNLIEWQGLLLTTNLWVSCAITQIEN